MKIFQEKYLKSINYSQRDFKPCRGLMLFGCVCMMLGLTNCDKVINDVAPPQPPIIPQATTEVFKQMYPDVATFIFKPLETDKTWQADFISPKGKVSSLVDSYGEIIDLNELVGITKTLPSSIKQYIFSNYPNAQITTVYDVMKSSTQTDGYKLTIQPDKTTLLNVFFDANSTFLREEKVQTDKVAAIIFTSTDQVNFDPKIPAVVRQFISNNQLKDASVIIYGLADNSYKLILNFRERPNGALLTSEIVLSEQGKVLQWVSSIEREIVYKPLKKNEIPSEITDYLNTYIGVWTLEYGVSETVFTKNNTNYVTIKNGFSERFLVIDSELEKKDLILIRSQVLEEKDLPNLIKNTLTNTFSNWAFASASVTYEPRYQATKQGGTTPDHYQVVVKQGSDRYATRIGNDGKVIVKYRIQ